jgi:TatD DNase family protein
VITDAHSHLDAFTDGELATVLDRARAAGVERIVTVGMDVATSAKGVAIAEAEAMVFAAVGLHPWLAQDHPEGAPIGELRELAGRGKVVAIGEIGLDFVDNSWRGLSYEDPALRGIQERVFREQLRLARSLDLPVIMHSRGAHDTVLRILEEEEMDVVGGCVQFFEGTPQHVERYVGLGFTFTIGSSVTFPDQGGWHDTVRAIPEDALLLESDAPWLPFAGKESDRSSPADLVHIGGVVAQLRGVSAPEVFAAATRNLPRALPRVAAPS